MALNALDEMDQIISLLERGTIIIKHSKHRSEQRRLILVREARQLLWSLVNDNTRAEYEGSLELREIREIRVGKCSKEFRNSTDDQKRFEPRRCFVLLHGSAFKLKSFSAVAHSELEADNWVRGLRYLVQDTINAPYPLQVECWLRREYYNIENANASSSSSKSGGGGGLVNVKDFKSFLAGVSCKLTTSKLMDCIGGDIRAKSDLSFDDFARLYRKLLLPTNFATHDLFCTAPNTTTTTIGEIPYSQNGKEVTQAEFQKFLIEEQHMPASMCDESTVSTFIRDFVQDVERDVGKPHFTVAEFLDVLFSRQNDLWDPERDRVYMDMKQPMASYWISSSHNTYLTGDQFSSESSCEAYARALRQGCRCIELDCWNGPDNLPYIFHGHTITSKIKFKDVIKTIKEHAFVTSEYPVILSIEQNCSLEQQRNMAQALIDVFGEMLLTQSCDRMEMQLPSPYQLRRRIILKHKKLPQFEETSSSIGGGAGPGGGSSNFVGGLTTISSRSSLSGASGGGTDEGGDNIRNVLKEGTMYFKDPVDRTWNLYHFVLTQQELIYSSETEDRSGIGNGNSGVGSGLGGDDDDSGFSMNGGNLMSSALAPKVKDNLHNDELHFGENWFHGKLEGGRQEADQLLDTYKHLGDGTFLVRESATFVGDYSLSVWRRNRPNHCRIKLKHENGTTKYYLVDNCMFDSLYSLIVYYRKNMLRGAEFSIILREPVPQPRKHETQDWFHPQTTKEEAEHALIRCDVGSFLVRPSEHSSNAFVISFTINRKIKHCRIRQEGRLYVVDTTQFESLVSLVQHFMRTPLYRSVKLLYPVSLELLRQKLLAHKTSLEQQHIAVQQQQQQLHNGNNDFIHDYMDPQRDELVTCKTLYSYKASKPDELSFPKHAIITNVQLNNSLWWRGDYGGMIQRHFPANYVKVIDSALGDDYNNSLLTDDASSEIFLRTDSIEIHGAIPILNDSNEPGLVKTLEIQTPAMQNPFKIGFDMAEAAREWYIAIQEAAQIANQLDTERRKKERLARVAKEMSDLIIYFRSVPFREQSWVFYEMSSFPETKAEKQFLQQNVPLFVSYHRQHISRVYPKGQRLDSSNFNPVPFWNVGSQMVALNYQTGDRAMQYNHAKFRNNGACGYVLKPKFMQADNYDPRNALSTVIVGGPIMEQVISLRIIAARHLFRGGKSNNPLVVVEVAGATYDTGVKYRTRAMENGFNPVWNESCEFTVKNPQLALLRFELLDEDMFAETHFIAQASYAMDCIRTGYRSVTLRNKFSEELELASLLIHIDVRIVDSSGDSPSFAAGDSGGGIDTPAEAHLLTLK